MVQKETLFVALRPCSLGLALVATSEKGICALLLGDDADALNAELARRFPQARIRAADSACESLAAEAIALVDAPDKARAIPLDLRGTPFQRRVWDALRAIPSGRTASYADVANSIGAPKATRAVAGACAANPVAIAVPCHRVLHRDGTLSGYRWGVARKRALLEREGCDIR
ncbi:MAG: methylated-DNA--[protein]-cysteine S-methyltransferase [Methylocystis sp.]|uniref:methylated-DNA--[protein]-cysteine S-methyltransferase n=1 Tax=Methylocystis sp. TaxID=1911079 RepID=UPI003DA3CF67